MSRAHKSWIRQKLFKCSSRHSCLSRGNGDPCRQHTYHTLNNGRRMVAWVNHICNTTFQLCCQQLYFALQKGRERMSFFSQLKHNVQTLVHYWILRTHDLRLLCFHCFDFMIFLPVSVLCQSWLSTDCLQVVHFQHSLIQLVSYQLVVHPFSSSCAQFFHDKLFPFPWWVHRMLLEAPSLAVSSSVLAYVLD